MKNIIGLVTRIICRNEKEPWGVYEVESTECQGKKWIIRGNAILREGTVVSVNIEKVNDPKWGCQWDIKEASTITGMDIPVLKMFLKFNVRGVGEKTTTEFANKVQENDLNEWERLCREDREKIEPMPKVDNYFEELRQNPGTLTKILGQKMIKIKGFGERKLIIVIHQWSEIRHEINVIIPIIQKFQKFITYEECQIISREINSLKLLADNPYWLSRLLPKRSFEFIDNVVRNVYGLELTDPKRIEAGMKKIISNVKGFCIPWDIFCSDLKGLLKLAFDFEIQPNERVIKIAESMVYSMFSWELEERIVNRLKEMRNSIITQRYSLGGNDFMSLDETQQQAVEKALHNTLSIISGCAGTGKTTVIRYICDALVSGSTEPLEETIFGRGMINLGNQRKEVSNKIHLLGPTGKSAMRIEEKTDIPAYTIHKKVSSGGKIKGTVIIDEASMIDAEIFDSLLDLMDPMCRLVLIGDTAQLPPVGRGKIFFDLVSSGKISMTQLKHVHRQREGGILENASIIHNCENDSSSEFLIYDLTSGDTLNDEFCYWNEDKYGSNDQRIQGAVEAVSHFREKGEQDIQVITPFNDTVKSLNLLLRDIMNPPSRDKIELGGLRMGDKVMCIRNQYVNHTLVVANGEQGIITGLNIDYVDVFFQISRKTERFEDESKKDIDLAYAITVHKSQGSEYKVVVFVIVSKYGPGLMNRKLLYTGVTRARKNLVLIGSRREISRYMGTSGEESDKKWSLVQKKL